MIEVKTGKIHELLLVSDKELFCEISLGLDKIAANANSMYKDSLLLKEHNRISSQNILFLLAEEEAGKFLLLLDAVRCPKANLAQHLKKFTDHVAKGIYAISSYWNPDSFSEVKKSVENYYRKRSLVFNEDGIEWTAQNPITTSREFAYYVDYIVTYTGKKTWINPSEDLCLSSGLANGIPEALEVVNAFVKSGFTKPDSLAVIADVWRPLEIKDNFRFSPDLSEMIDKTFLLLNKKGFLTEQANSLYKIIWHGWSFPMHSIPLTKSPDNN